MANDTDTGRGTAEQQGGLISGLLDWRFERYLTMQLLPLFYLLVTFAAVAVIAGIVALAFLWDTLAGFITLAIAPFVLLIAVAVIRAVLEYLVMAHRIMRVVEDMDRIPGQVAHLTTRVDVVTAKMDDMGDRVEHIHGTVNMVRPLLRPATLPTRVIRGLLGRQDP